MKSLLLIFILISFLSCKQEKNQTTTNDSINLSTPVAKDSGKTKKATPTKFYIKDESKYSQAFLKEFKEVHSTYESTSLLDDTILLNNDKKAAIIIPTDLPLSQTIAYEKTEKDKKYSLTVKRINFSTIEYQYYETVHQKKQMNDREPPILKSSIT